MRGPIRVRTVWQGPRVQVSAHKPFALLDVVPDSLRGVILDFEWGRERLWALDAAVERIAVGTLRWQLTLPWWSFEGVPFAISPAEVRADPRRYHLQHARTVAADLSFPVHVLARADGVVIVLDGVHRLLKAHLLRQSTLQVKAISMAQLDTIART